MTTNDRAAHAYVGAFVDELARAGVRHACIAPGSRSTPLALMLAAHEDVRVWVHLDERSAGFFALGMARTLGEPVALLCTSGSAAANFFPAVVEARSANIPLLVLTADRPPELREVGSAQTIDQNALYGAHAKWFVEVALPEATPELLRYVRTLAGRAAAMARATPAGPVHLNFPFREPLVPVATGPASGLAGADRLAWTGRPDGEPWVRVTDAPTRMDEAEVQRIAALLRAARRPLLVCGPQYDAALAAPLAALAVALGAPLLADPLSQLRWGAHDRGAVVDRYDAALRHEETAAALAPDLVLRFGAIPTSKPLIQYLQRHGVATSIVVNAAGWSDPTLLAAEMVHAEPAAFCAALVAAVAGGAAGGATGGAAGDNDDMAVGGPPRTTKYVRSAERASPIDRDVDQSSAWLAEWRAVNDATAGALARCTASFDEPFEGRALAAIAAAVPDGGTLFVSSSMPVRDLDAFAAGDGRALRVLANRGANGIDGIVSTALGTAAALRERGERPLVLAIGDLALYHDMNGLLAAKLHALDATIVVINNDGGGIFSFLPQAAEPAHFEQLFGTPHGLSFAPVAELYGARHTLVRSVAEIASAVADGVAGGGLHLVELRTDRTRNVALHRMAWGAVAGALEGLGIGDEE